MRKTESVTNEIGVLLSIYRLKIRFFASYMVRRKKNSLKFPFQELDKNNNKTTADIEFNTLIGQTVRHCLRCLFTI